MKLLARSILLISLGVLISGCIEMHTVVTVKKDGSGLVEENIFIGKEIITISFTLFAVIDMLGSIPVLVSLREKMGAIGCC